MLRHDVAKNIGSGVAAVVASQPPVEHFVFSVPSPVGSTVVCSGSVFPSRTIAILAQDWEYLDPAVALVALLRTR
eukprot:2391592-Amphidinium_carterae.1